MLPDHATLREIRDFLLREITRLYSGGEAASMIDLIMEHLGYPSRVFLSDPGRSPGQAAVAQIKEIVADLHRHRPIQYILGYTSFCDLSIRVNSKVLIPRPETEEMVYRILKSLKKLPRRILDLGSGSGCIALALKKHYPEALVVGLEKSSGALEVARENSRAQSLKVEWTRGNMFDLLFMGTLGTFDLMVSNPPYVRQSERALMERNVLDHEPAEALFVEDHDPLRYYRGIAALTGRSLSSGGFLWLEINEKFGHEVSEMMGVSGLKNIQIHQDIHGKDRFIEAQK
jgi:release factor glutamine methyltransferase